MDETHRLKYTEYVVGCVSPILHYFLAPWEREGIAEEHLLFHVGTVSRGKISCVSYYCSMLGIHIYAVAFHSSNLLASFPCGNDGE